MADNNDQTYLQIKNLNKSFDGVNVLHDISLDCQRGELICLLGPSGCGKTTLLRIIAGLEKQDQGQVIQDAVDISNFPVENRDFGIVFQNYALFPNLTVSQNIGFGLRKQSKEKTAARVTELLKTIGLEDHADKYPSQLSGGQQQRVALARALAISPGLLLLDEPLSALDTKVRGHLRQEIKSLQRKLGITTIMVTHDQDEAMSMADRIVVLKDGVIEQVGTPHEIYSKPATPFVANFIGSMSFMPATHIQKDTLAVMKSFINCELPEWIESGELLQLGVRPEHVSVKPINGSPVKGLSGTVEKFEYMGAYLRLYVQVAEANDDGITVLVDVDDHENTFVENMPVELNLKQNSLAFYPAERV